MIRLNALHKYFNRGKQNEIHVLNDVTLELPERGMVAIFGKSGCGKTTLLNVIGGLDRYASGSLTVEGREIREDPDGIRARYMGYIFQNYNLQSGETCFENVAAALRLAGMEDEETVSARVTAALANVGMEKYASRTPDTLSGGQQQRIAIARAIVKNPRIILADEPTGNLDEANTVMIMELLREIADTHLVLLVTHEESLVDRYCDKIIEMADGRVGSIRDNAAVGSTATRSRNDIYLGELEHTTLSGDAASIDYWGEPPSSPINLSIVSSGGKLYLKVNTPGVQILDGGSEVRLVEGVFEEKTAKEADDARIDMSALPPFEGKRYGRLFTLRSALRDGYISSFLRGKRSKRALRACMCMFAAVLVLMTAVFGTAFSTLSEIDASYNHNTFYVYDPDGSVSEKLHAALAGGEAAIDQLRIHGIRPPSYVQPTVSVITDFFETFVASGAAGELSAVAVCLDETRLSTLPTVLGKTKDLADSEIVITTAVADALLENATLSFLDEYRDLIGLATSYLPAPGLRVVGIVDSDERALYLSETAAAKMALETVDTYVTAASDYKLTVEPGTVALAIRDKMLDEADYPAVGEAVMLHGKSFTVGSVIRYTYGSYDEWLRQSGEYVDEYTFITEKIKAEHPDYTDGTEESSLLYNEYFQRCYFDYLDAYYAKLDRFLLETRIFDYPLSVWLYLEKGVKEALGQLMHHDSDLYLMAQAYKEKEGAYPTLEEAQLGGVFDGYERPSEVLMRALLLYENEYYANSNNHDTVWGHEYLLSDADLVAVSKQLGETDPSATYTLYDKSEAGRYLLVHSTAPSITAAYLKNHLAELEPPEEYLPAVLTPSGIREVLLSDSAASIAGNLIALVVVLAVMSLCMYFIMRSSLLARVREVGVWRAIGVSRKNLVFRFLIEAAVLTTLTVFVGYLPTSILLLVGTGGASLLSSVLYYPLPLALLLFFLLYGICLLTGILPILGLVRRTPSEILAKYDI